MATRISSVKIALPMMTNGLRARFDRRVGTWTCSGSNAARGERGVIRFCSASDAPMPSWGRAEIGGYGSPISSGVRPPPVGGDATDRDAEPTPLDIESDCTGGIKFDLDR